ncbi:hypothetical protein [Halorhodospira halochloris]|uniref:hypothetical protein n=1 Tax=Halorhodospira halochloris TaxID=1052 RepID=UPI001EE997F2|nr:hypothetical protein [Halorhodospira halochloris]MCG5549200.1 hypothetical protein [Halorhodospira halochloris]
MAQNQSLAAIDIGYGNVNFAKAAQNVNPEVGLIKSNCELADNVPIMPGQSKDSIEVGHIYSNL